MKGNHLLGVYTLPEAEMLTGVSARALKRWLFGYNYPVKTSEALSKHFSNPLWVSQYRHDEFHEYVVGFRDLLEARVVGEFVKIGVPLIVIRACLESARELFGTDYPLTAHKFLTDGKTIYRDALKRNANDPSLLNLKSRQYAFDSVIRPSLYAGIEYTGTIARRWFPETKQKSVVLDPTIAFGKPHILDVGVPTAAIYSTYLAEGKNASQTARIFELSKRQVDAAVRFEERLVA
jgi:uncharacterized protein (DUF433 family)